MSPDHLRHARPNRCPRCNAATFRVEVGYVKPVFVCDNGCSQWESGRDGEPYLAYARNYGGGGAAMWVSHQWRDGKLVCTGAPVPAWVTKEK